MAQLRDPRRRIRPVVRNARDAPRRCREPSRPASDASPGMDKSYQPTHSTGNSASNEDLTTPSITGGRRRRSYCDSPFPRLVPTNRFDFDDSSEARMSTYSLNGTPISEVYSTSTPRSRVQQRSYRLPDGTIATTFSKSEQDSSPVKTSSASKSLTPTMDNYQAVIDEIDELLQHREDEAVDLRRKLEAKEIETERQLAEKDREIAEVKKLLAHQLALAQEKKDCYEALHCFDTNFLEAVNLIEEKDEALEKAEETIKELKKKVMAARIDKEILRQQMNHLKAVSIKLLNNMERLKEQLGETEEAGEVVKKMEDVERMLLAMVEVMKSQAIFIADF